MVMLSFTIQVSTFHTKGRFMETILTSSLMRLGELLPAMLSSVFQGKNIAVSLHHIDVDYGTFPIEQGFT